MVVLRCFASFSISSNKTSRYPVRALHLKPPRTHRPIPRTSVPYLNLTITQRPQYGKGSNFDATDEPRNESRQYIVSPPSCYIDEELHALDTGTCGRCDDETEEGWTRRSQSRRRSSLEDYGEFELSSEDKDSIYTTLNEVVDKLQDLKTRLDQLAMKTVSFIENFKLRYERE